MGSQVGTCHKTPVALVALERPLLRVSPSYVDRQGALVFEALGTRLALKRPLLRVNPFVLSQVALNAEALGALATLERPLPIVNPFVRDQGARRWTYALAAWPVAYDGHSLVGH